ncbi:MAG: DUF2271 domain-containing protein [Treponema sp.]|nr:DUF2271 domain-containing protein [Treponema sp.]
MKKIIFIFILTALVISYASAQQTAAEITFTFTRQSGSASNQYAVWIENAQGQLVKTLYATRWTANGGYRSRPSSIPVWVKLSDLANMSRSQIDAVSSATPRTGTVTYAWDGTDSRGAAVPQGNYVMVLEGTLRWENQVLYRAPFRLGQGMVSLQVSVEYQGDSTAERGMISDVRVRVLR